MLGLALRPVVVLLLMAAVASPTLAMPTVGAPAAPDPEQAAGWTLRRVGDAEERAGVELTDPVDEAARPALDAAIEAYGTADAAAADALAFVESQVVDPLEETAADLQDEVEGVLAPPPPRDTPAAEPQTAATQPLLPTAVAQALVVAGAAAAGTLLFVWLTGSSGTLGAGAAGSAAGAKAAGSDLRRLLPFASPLFTRFEKDTVLGHPKREALYALIMQTPGVSLQALCQETGLSRTAVAHHLRLLELQHLVVSKRHGRSRHYFENGGRYGREQKDGYAVLQNARSKSVADFIRDHPGAIQKDLCAALGLQASIAHWHARRLQEALLVEPVRQGRTVAYFPSAGLQQLAAAPALPPPSPAALPPAWPSATTA